MKQFSYRIDTDFFKEYPYYCRGVVVFNGLNNARPSSALSALLRECEAGLRQRIQGNVAEYPHVAAWREAYRQFGAKPSEHRSSIEALSRRVLKPSRGPEQRLASLRRSRTNTSTFRIPSSYALEAQS